MNDRSTSRTEGGSTARKANREMRTERDATRAALARVKAAIDTLSSQLIHGYPNQHAPLLSAVEVRVSVLDHLRVALQGDANPEATDA